MRFFAIFFVFCGMFFVSCNRVADTSISSQPPAVSCPDLDIRLDSLYNRLAAEEPLDQLSQELTQARTDLRYCTDSARVEQFSRIADLLRVQGNGLLKQEEPVKSRPYFFEALEIRRNTIEDPHDWEILRLYFNLGVTFQGESDYENALVYLDSANVMLEDHSVLSSFLCKLKQGEIYLDLGEVNMAYSQLEVALPNVPQWEDYKEYRMDFFWALAYCYRQLDQLSKGLQVLETGINENKAGTDDPHLADLYLVAGNIWQDSMDRAEEKTGPYEAAVKNTSKALELYARQKLNSGMTIAAANLGELHRRGGELENALHVLTHTLDSLQGNGNQADQYAQLFINRGEVHYGRGDLNRAMTDYDSALHRLIPVYRAGGPLPSLNAGTSNPEYLMVLYGDIAQIHIERFNRGENAEKNLQAAVALYDSLFSLVHISRGEFTSDEAKLRLAEKSQDVLRKAVWGYTELYRLTNDIDHLKHAFRIAEQSQAFVLLEAARLKSASNSLPPRVRRQELDLLAQKNQIEADLIKHAGNDSLLQLGREEKLENFEGIRKFQETLKKNYPNYFALKYQGADLSVADVQKTVLEKKQGLVEYFFQDSVMHIFCITQQSFDFKSIPIHRDSLNTLVGSFTDLLKYSGKIDTSREKEICRKGYDLYRLLILPVENLLPERVVIIPSGILTNLPFETLLTVREEKSLKHHISRENFLLFKHSISYCFSANLLSLMKSFKRENGLKKGLAVFATAFHPDLSQNRDQNLLGGLKKALPYLAHLGLNQNKEVKALSEKIEDVEVYPESLATKEQFLKACQQYSILHVPTHGILNEEDPGLSFIAFTQKEDTLDIGQVLFLKDLYSQSWNLDFAFFSACQTASGRYAAGEGNLSMARGLAYAGVKSFITTLWNVPTEAKAVIAPDFYDRFLNQSKPKDVALAEAKRKAAKTYVHPNDWASIILIGPAGNPEKPGIPAQIWIAGGVIFGLAGWRLRRRKAGNS